MFTSIFRSLKRARRPGAPASSVEVDARQGSGAGSAASISRLEMVEHLKRVIDPEVGLNIVDLGLVYGMELEGKVVHVTLTMTTPACPMSRYIMQRTRKTLERIEGVEEVEIDLVWEPPWSAHMIDPESRRRLWGIR